MTMISESLGRARPDLRKHPQEDVGPFVPFDEVPSNESPLYHRLRFPDPIPIPDDHHADIDPWSDL